MRFVVLIGLALGLGACGADGEPVQPTAQAHVQITSDGVALGSNLRVSQGPVAVSLGVAL